MDDLPLVVEGFENKIKRLFIQANQLKTENVNLKDKVSQLSLELDSKEQNISLLAQELESIKLAKKLDSLHPGQAKQKINDLLREIEKCYSLLNR